MAGVMCGSLSARASITQVATSGSWDGNPPGTLSTVMQNMLGQPGYDVNAAGNRVDDSVDQVWTAPTGSGASTLLLAIAGYAGNNSFGIYNLATGAKLQIFSGIGSMSAPVPVPVTFVNGSASVGGGPAVEIGTDFGFYLGTAGSPNGYWYSQQSLNQDNGGDHMVTLTTSSTQTLTPSAAVTSTGWTAAAGNLAWNPGSYLLGWEDLPVSNPNMGDVDYQDMVVEVSGFTPVPEPTTVLAGALLLLPFGASTLRILRRKRAA